MVIIIPMVKIKNTRNLIPAFIAADLVITVLAKLLHSAFTIYELLLIFYEFGCILAFVYLIVTKKVKPVLINFLGLSCFMAFGVAAYSTLTYGQANIHGDTAIATLLARAELKYHSLMPRSWAYANGDIWLLDTQLATLPFTLILKNQPLARMLGTLVMMIAGAIGLYLLDRHLLHSSSYMISIPVLFVFFFGGNYTLMWGNDHILYQASYTCWLFLIPVMLILTFGVLTGNKDKKLIILYLVFGIICYARGVRSAAELMIPVVLAFILHEMLKDSRLLSFIKKDRLIRLCLLLVPMVTGLILYKIICMTHIVNISSTSSAVFVSELDEIFTNFTKVLSNLFNIFGYNRGVSAASIEGLANLVSIICCLLFVFILPALQAMKLKDESEGVRFFYAFAMIHNMEMLIATVCFSGKTSPSHILTFVIMSVMVSSHYVMKYWMSSKELGNIFGLLFICASLIMTAQLGMHCRGWSGQLKEKRSTADALIEHGLQDHMGYGTFWNIYPLSIYSDLKLDVAAIGHSDLAVGLTPHDNLVDINKYSPSQDKAGAYILLNYNENQEIGGELEAVIGECSDKFNIGENYIYVWDHDICEYLE